MSTQNRRPTPSSSQEQTGMGTILTTSQVAAICRVAPNTAASWLDTGKVIGYRTPTVRGEAHRRFDGDSVARMMREVGAPLWMVRQLRDPYPDMNQRPLVVALTVTRPDPVEQKLELIWAEKGGPFAVGAVFGSAAGPVDALIMDADLASPSLVRAVFKYSPSTLLIATSGRLTQAQVKKDATCSACDLYLPSPVDSSILLHHIQEAGLQGAA